LIGTIAVTSIFIGIFMKNFNPPPPAADVVGSDDDGGGCCALASCTDMIAPAEYNAEAASIPATPITAN
jgi:hypothetical protein